MAAEKVGDLVAELSLKDDLTKDMVKAERNFKKSAKGMDEKAHVELDDSKLESGLQHAKTKMKEGGKKGIEGLGEAVSSGMCPIGEQLSGGLMSLGALGGAALYKGVTEGMSRKAGSA